MVPVLNDIVNGVMWMDDTAVDILYQILCLILRLILSVSVEQA